MKKCKYCMSDIDEKAIICPHCKKRQNTSKIIILLIIALIIILTFLLVEMIIRSYVKDKVSNIDIEDDAMNFIYNAIDKNTERIINGENFNEACYEINSENYIGSVKYWIDENEDSNYKIWLSNGNLYLTGSSRNDFEISESNKIATTNCED